MFDPYDQVRMRTQQLLASASRIREERALNAAARQPRTVDTAVACTPETTRVETPAAFAVHPVPRGLRTADHTSGPGD